jgi:hypothetical protein
VVTDLIACHHSESADGSKNAAITRVGAQRMSSVCSKCVGADASPVVGTASF